MKKLTLLRHAKSGWTDPLVRDFDRPLSPRGSRAAIVMGRHLRALGCTFDYVLASSAVRVVETVGQMESGGYGALAPNWNRQLYLASAPALLDVVQELPDSAVSALLIGHNPGLEELVLDLVPERPGDALREAVEIKFPTASMAEIHFTVERWEQVKLETGTLVRFIRPRDLDASLGPDSE